MDPTQTPRRSPASSVATSPDPPYKLTNDDIEAVIQMATTARPTPDGRPVPPRDTRTQLFVGNLPYRVRWQDLKDLFRRAGTVLRADVSLGPDNRSRGYGTVLLATAEDAGRAVDMFNGYSWQTRILEVRPDRLPPDLDNSLGSLPSSAVTGLPTAVGPLTSILQSVHGHSPPLNLQNRADELEYGALVGAHDLSAVSGGIGRALFVGNLPFHCQWQDLKDLFRQAGTIIRADVALGPDGRSRGFGTVIFASEGDAEHAMNVFNGYEYNGRILKVHFDKYTQLGQTISYPASPSLHSMASPASLTSTALNNLNNTPSFGVSYPAQVSQASVHSGYNSDFMSRSRSSSSPELYQMPAPVSHQQRRVPPLPAAQSPPMVDISAITLSLGSTHLTNETVSLDSSPLKQSPASESASSSTSSSASRAPSAPASNTSSSAEKNVPLSGSHHHPHHPGPITLPPPPAPFPLALHKLSNQNESTPSAQTPVFSAHFIHHQQIAPTTPHGLPPITPSMPPFTFLPPQLSPPQYPPQIHGLSDTSANLFTPSQIPSPLDHPSSPLYGPSYALTGFSPGGPMSPGAFYGRPGNPNPHINPAVGAPVHAPHSNGSGLHVHSMSSSNRLSRRCEPTSYFDLEYFPRDSNNPSYVSSSLANEILRDKDETSPQCGQEDDLKCISD